MENEKAIPVRPQAIPLGASPARGILHSPFSILNLIWARPPQGGPGFPLQVLAPSAALRSLRAIRFNPSRRRRSAPPKNPPRLSENRIIRRGDPCGRPFPHGRPFAKSCVSLQTAGLNVNNPQ
jgi:hypothetical protein